MDTSRWYITREGGAMTFCLASPSIVWSSMVSVGSPVTLEPRESGIAVLTNGVLGGWVPMRGRSCRACLLKVEYGKRVCQECGRLPEEGGLAFRLLVSNALAIPHTAYVSGIEQQPDRCFVTILWDPLYLLTEVVLNENK